MATDDVTQSDVTAPLEDIVKFGNASLTDVIFLVGDKQFMCHKMLLAAKCEYFAGMFASGFKEKNDATVTIDADPAAFKNLMEILYNGRIGNDEDLFKCDLHKKFGITNGAFNKKMWGEVISLFVLADRFLLTDVVRYSIESALLRYDQQCPHGKKGCYHCATKLLLALRFDMNYYKTINVSARKTIKKTIDRMDETHLDISSHGMSFLLDRD